jgi:hypothetical protein
LLRELLGIVLKREEAISVIKELLDNCNGLDGHYLELSPPNDPVSMIGGYQIIIGKALDEKTKNCIQNVLKKYQLTYQIGSIWKTKRSKDREPDTFIIYRPKSTALDEGKHLGNERP